MARYEAERGREIHVDVSRVVTDNDWGGEESLQGKVEGRVSFGILSSILFHQCAPMGCY